MITRVRRHEERSHNQDRWLLTYADMITLLTAFFLMLYSMSVVSRGKFTELASSVRMGFGGASASAQARSSASPQSPSGAPLPSQESFRNLASYVEQHHLKAAVDARSDERGIVISLVSDDMLFLRGSASVQEASTGLLNQVAGVLRSMPNRVQIEGHTCSLPIHTSQFPSNWELSTARAAAILRYFTETSGMDAARFQAAGYADVRPIAPNDSEVNRKRNRRVEIVLLKSDAEREAERARQAEMKRVLTQRGAGRPSTLAN